MSQYGSRAERWVAEQWPAIHARGMWHFVLRKGVGLWGGLVFGFLVLLMLVQLGITHPRLPLVLDHRAASTFTGLLLVLLGVLTSLPIPLTNMLFGAMVLMFALALLERDGALMLLAWLATGVAVTVSGVLSGTLVEQGMQWLHSLGSG